MYQVWWPEIPGPISPCFSRQRNCIDRVDDILQTAGWTEEEIQQGQQSGMGGGFGGGMNEDILANLFRSQGGGFGGGGFGRGGFQGF